MTSSFDFSAPHLPPLTARWIIRSGGRSKEALLAGLQTAGVQLNAAAVALFADERFTTSPVSRLIETVALSVAALGFQDGATFTAIVERATRLGLSLCPLELGPHLRLQLPEQAEGFLGAPLTQHRAPPGSLTVASAPLAEDDAIPKGFYLRRIAGVLWLRGYYSDLTHIWSPPDVLVFSRTPHPAASAVAPKRQAVPAPSAPFTTTS